MRFATFYPTQYILASMGFHTLPIVGTLWCIKLQELFFPHMVDQTQQSALL